jgi:V/A-type H+/Na+-transporting ATPase subunit I
MIEDVVKYFIMGIKQNLDRFFDQAQEQGFMEFISVAPKKQLEAPIIVQNLLAAHKILRKQPVRDPYLGGGDRHLAMQVSERIIELKEDLEKLGEEKRVLDTEIVRVAPFGNFSMDDIDYIEKQSGRKIQFFCMKTAKNHEMTLPEEVIYIATEYDLDYYITISSQPVFIPGMIEMRIDAPLGELENRLDFVEDSIHRFEVELKEYAGYIDFLQHILIEELNKHHLAAAKKEVAYPLQNSLFIIEAWIPENKVPMLFGLIDGMDIHAQQVAIESDERVPTVLQNKGMGMVGEDLTKLYDIPSTTDKDPSSWVLYFFAFFFAIIVGDAGYGVLFLAVAFYLKKKFPHLQGQQKRMLKLFFLLSAACIVWGAMISSYFGLKLAPSNPLSHYSPLHYLAEKKADYHMAVKDDVYHSWLVKFPQLGKMTAGRQMLEISVLKKTGTQYPIMDEFTGNITFEFVFLIGILHVSIAFCRYLTRNWAGLGWIFFLIGGYLYFPIMLKAVTMTQFIAGISPKTAGAFGLQCVYGGIAFAVIAAVIQRRWRGLNEIANVVQIFSDIMSYARLYALSLAGAIMAATFNQEGSALGLFFGFIIILAGHCVNMGLSFMGGIIHGLRLNFLEWYHYCFNGGGRLFKPLHKLKTK